MPGCRAWRSVVRCCWARSDGCLIHEALEVVPDSGVGHVGVVADHHLTCCTGAVNGREIHLTKALIGLGVAGSIGPVHGYSAGDDDQAVVCGVVVEPLLEDWRDGAAVAVAFQFGCGSRVEDHDVVDLAPAIPVADEEEDWSHPSEAPAAESGDTSSVDDGRERSGVGDVTVSWGPLVGIECLGSRGTGDECVWTPNCERAVVQ